ncbi:hypothetical protein KB206_16750 [Microvirga sp. STS02]|uniref:hypothetical protein n=1 Tax=Hymenobacter negativus TaxID=2795026 RepID=UPI0018DC1C74|nr:MULTISPECIES: hypothetical protein [Bacteria]MBH8570543.1 hypothetical protein [Hymenobacter negativus]MBR7210282.1 hypothetical protein [Microvirga sp. STS02]
MKTANFLAPVLLAGTFLMGCSKDAPTPAPTPTASTIKVTVSEAGAPVYDLNEARVVDGGYLTGSPRLSITGKLGSGKTMVLNFTKGSATTNYTTNALTGTLDGVTGTNFTGTTTYDPQTKLVNGDFRATFPVVGEVVGTFANIQF